MQSFNCVEGGTLNFTCQGVSGTGISVDPNSITIQKNDVIFMDDHLSTSFNATHRLFNYGPLSRSVNGEMIQCTMDGISSGLIPIQVYC